MSNINGHTKSLLQRKDFMAGHVHRKNRIDSPCRREGACTWESWDYIKKKVIKCKKRKTGWFFCDEHKKMATEIENGSFAPRSMRVSREDD